MSAAFAFIMATQNKHHALFYRLSGAGVFLDRLPEWRPDTALNCDGPAAASIDWRHAFWVNTKDVVTADDMCAEVAAGELFIIHDCGVDIPSRLVSVWPMEAFDFFTRHMAVVADTGRFKGNSHRRRCSGELEDWELAWLTQNHRRSQQGGGTPAPARPLQVDDQVE